MPTSPFPSNFRKHSQELLHFLSAKYPMALWMVTRVCGNEWTVLDSKDRFYGVKPEDVFDWSGSFCYRMIQGEGPRIAPKVSCVSAYSEAPIAQQFPINSYVGVPILHGDTELFGTLCAIDPAEKNSNLVDELPTIQACARLLSGILSTELELERRIKTAQRLERLVNIDSHTGLANRYAWDSVLQHEESQCKTYANAASIIIIDLNNLKEINDSFGHAEGDRAIRNVAAAIQAAVPETTITARIGGDEFGILLTQDSAEYQAEIFDLIRVHISHMGINAATGFAHRIQGESLAQTCVRADMAMYENKRYIKDFTSSSEPENLSGHRIDRKLSA